MPSNEYWRERAMLVEEASHKIALDTYADIEKAFLQAQNELTSRINTWMLRLAKNNEISMTEARRLLDRDELEEFHWDVFEYIKHGQENEVSQQWVKELENASAKVHIRKLEALKIETQDALENVYAIYNGSVHDMARKVYEHGFYRTAYELSKGFGVGVKVPTINYRAVDNIIGKPWAADGRNFSSRIWADRQSMVNSLHQELTRTTLLGGKPDEAIANLTKCVKNTVKNKRAAAGRLVQTEQAFFCDKAAIDSYKSLGVEKIEFVATLDLKTSEICREMDGTVIELKDAEPGVNTPPLHPRCRSVIAPYYDDNDDGLRAMRNKNGKTEYINSDITYQEWYRRFT